MERRVAIPHNEQMWTEWQHAGIQIKRFISLAMITAVAVIVIGFAAWLAVSTGGEKRASAEHIPFQVNNKLVATMLGGELFGYASYQPKSSYTLSEAVSGVISSVSQGAFGSQINLVTSELPLGQTEGQAYLMESGAGSDPNISPLDEHQYTYDELSGDELDAIINELKLPEDDIVAPTSNDTPANEVDVKNSVVFIYHTHNRESWNGEVEENEKNASSKSKNITLVGQRLGKQLEAKGMKTMVSDTDYPTVIPEYEWSYSYKYSRKTVKEAMASNDQLQFFFDLHRDSQTRKYTTADIEGKSYAQVYFIIGQRNPNWKANEAFAKKIHNKLEQKYPGLSRGIWGKTASSGNAEYNQSLSSQNVLIEIGGVDNTLEESYRTADALAEVIAEIYKENNEKT